MDEKIALDNDRIKKIIKRKKIATSKSEKIWQL